MGQHLLELGPAGLLTGSLWGELVPLNLDRRSQGHAGAGSHQLARANGVNLFPTLSSGTSQR